MRFVKHPLLILLALAIIVAAIVVPLVLLSGPSKPTSVSAPLVFRVQADGVKLRLGAPRVGSASAPTVGELLTASTGGWNAGGGTLTFAWQWEQCNSSGAACTNIGGAISQSYTIVTGDIGHTIRVVVTASNSAGTGAPATSAPTGVVTASVGTIVFNGDFEGGSHTQPTAVQPWGGTPQSFNWQGLNPGAHWFGDFYYDNGSSSSPTTGSLFNAASSAVVPPLAGSWSGRIVLPKTPSGPTLTNVTLQGLSTPVPGDIGSTNYYGIAFWVPSGEQINSNAFQGMNLWEQHFNAVWGAPVALQLHTTGPSAVNGTGSSVVIALETGACNSSNSANYTQPFTATLAHGCQIRSNAGASQCSLPSQPNIGTVTCLPGFYAIPPGGVQYGTWNELVFAVNEESNSTGSIQSYYKTWSSPTWIPYANITGIPTIQWDVAKGCASPPTTTQSCGYPAKEDSELYGGAQTAPFSMNIDNQLIGTSLAVVEAQMPTTGSSPVTPSNTVLPVISGTAQQGSLLSTTTGTWSGSPTPSYTYQWKDCDSAGNNCTNVSGTPPIGTTNTYTPTSVDIGHTIRVVVMATNSAGNASATAVQTSTVLTSSSSFVQGVCSPSPCTVTGKVGFHVSALDSSPNSVYGAGFTTVAPNAAIQVTASNNVSVERPGNLSASTQAPLVIGTSQPIANHWETAAAKYGFVYVHINSFPSGIPYSAPAGEYNAAQNGTATGCGSGGGNACDMVPLIIATIHALSCPVANGFPCENINPNEVFIGGNYSGEGVFTQSVMCDSRMNGLIAGAQIVSASTLGWELSGGTATRATANLPNCPALLGVGPHCKSDCVVPSRTTALSVQYVYGDNDGVYKARLLAGGAYPSLPVNWQWSDPDVLGSTSPGLFGAGLGCSSTPSIISGQGLTGKITFSTYTSCTHAGAAVQGIFVSGGGHGIDTTGTAFNSLGVCTSGCVQNVNSDGLSDPDAAWAFWTAHFP